MYVMIIFFFCRVWCDEVKSISVALGSRLLRCALCVFCECVLKILSSTVFLLGLVLRRCTFKAIVGFGGVRPRLARVFNTELATLFLAN